ncbi:hypothetical protein LX16_2040 [Stackebrandtia albiflava]|uniref:Uncharacterized protein n=1 Tax=Stackebrandtia albiflava TaxID=406432 RepID=A0A562VEQ5_9ACTN|nr:hypothetical protein [Stackebrandtia albiflava]TWJ16311.1 hypothetical protein LX16_2040 [Stackebrandtia albiflava]
MTEDLRERIDAELPDPPFTIDVDETVARGRRIRYRRRAVTAVAAVTASVIAVTVIALAGDALPTAAPPADEADVTSAPEPEPQPWLTLPELDPDKEYEWFDEGAVTKTDATDAYSAALLEFLDLRYPGHEHPDTSSGTSVEPVGEEAPEFFRVTRQLMELTWSGPDDGYDPRPVHLQPLYTLGYASGNDIQTPAYIKPEATGGFEELAVEIWPAGGYTEGEGGPVDLIECESYREVTDFDGESVVDITCTELDGPDGELVRQSVTEVSHSKTGDTFERILRTVTYRHDGTAVVVESRVASLERTPQTPLADLGDWWPAMTPEDQRELIATLPDAVVK